MRTEKNKIPERRVEAGQNQWISDLFRKALDIIEQVSITSAAEFLSISTIKIDRTFPTAAIGLRGFRTFLFVNPDFIAESASTPVKFATLLMHEIMHHLLGHTKEPKMDIYRACACDAVINATLSRLHPMFGLLPEDYYSGEEMPAKFLRPGSLVDYADDESIHRYAALWLPGIYGKKSGMDDSYLNEIDGYSEFFRKRTNGSVKNIVLFGTHNLGREESAKHKEKQIIMPAETVSGIQKEILAAIVPENGVAGGYCEKIFEMQVNKAEAAEITEDAREKMMKELRINAVRKVLDVFEVRNNAAERTVILPFEISRREIAMFGAGIYPAYFSVKKEYGSYKEAFVYIDVSGSMFGEIEFVYSLLTALKEFLMPKIFNFSNKIVEITREDLMDGNIFSTGGTDFNCVCSHFLEQNAQKALIITDGYGEAEKSLAARVRKEKKMRK